MQGLCCLDAQGPPAAAPMHEFIDDSREGDETLAVAHPLLDEAFADRPACDELLVRHARHWELGRLAMVDRNILRLAVHEMRSGRAPVKVLITEAIRLAREFSTADSPRFVNGVLDAVAREISSSRDAGDAGDTSLAGRQEEEEDGGEKSGDRGA